MSHADNHDRERGYSDDDSYESDTEEKPEKPKTGVAMLSLLSFYGIQDTATQEDIVKNPEAFIDLPQFDSNAYVKKLLLESQMETLLSRDTQLVQEIRTLDSDMQMLVYENYNKFISATETIKRMKINVEVMDEDMADVKKKMETLCDVSVSLDNSLHNQRMKVDKIMRIKRLLNRLEFLTELPERLQEMISKEMYQKAVTLYNKTINVLTKHSGVLSLKNIKERTELMMIDLRSKVTNLLDDPLLETTKLTQYVTVLRMMQAPKPLVVQKLLAAHVSRARSIIKSFQATEYEVIHNAGKLSQGSAAASASASASASEKDTNISIAAGLTVSRTRKFHQLLLSGLMEACKGIHELFCNSQHILTDAPTSDSGGTISETTLNQDLKNHETAHKALVLAVEDLVGSNYASIMINQLSSFFSEYRLKSDEVKNLEQKIKDLNIASSSHEVDDEENNDRSIINETSREPSEKEVLDRNLRMLQLRLYDLEDECQNWLLLARQSILDLLYLETTVIECSLQCNGNKLRRKSLGFGDTATLDSGKATLGNMSFARTYAYDLLSIINSHVDYLFWRRILSFIPSFHISSNSLIQLLDLTSTVHIRDPTQGYMPSSVSHNSISQPDSTSASRLDIDIATSSHGGGADRLGHSSHGSSSVNSDPLSARYEVQRRVGEAKIIFDRIFDNLISIFSDILSDIKPLLEVYQTIIPSKTSKAHSSSSLSSSSSSPNSSFKKTLSLIPDVISGYLFTSSSSSSSSSPQVGTGKPINNSSPVRNVQRNILGVNLSNIINNVGGNNTTNATNTTTSHDYIMFLVWSYCGAVANLLEIHGGVTYATRIFHSSQGYYQPENDDDIFDKEMTNLSIILGDSSNSATSSIANLSISGDNSHKLIQPSIDGMIDDAMTTLKSLDEESFLPEIYDTISPPVISKRSIYSLISATLLKKISPIILRRLDTELKTQELPHLSKDSIFKAKCAARLELASQELLLQFVETCSDASRNLAINATSELVKSVRFASPSITSIEELLIDGKPGGISSRIVSLCHLMHHLCITCCIILGETPPQLKVSSGTSTNSGAAHRRTAAHRASLIPGGATATSHVHMDIERLFSQKINIYDYHTNGGSIGGTKAATPENRQLVASLDAVVGTFAKVSVKAIHEYVRFLNIPHLLYLQLQVQATVVKQISGYVLREATEVDGLIDQLNSTMFSRYLDANNISNYINTGNSNASDSNNDATVVSRAVSQAIQDIAKVAILIPRHS